MGNTFSTAYVSVSPEGSMPSWSSAWNRPRVARIGGDGQNLMPDGTTLHLALYHTQTCGYCRRVFRVIDSIDVNIEYRGIRSDREHCETLMTTTGRSTVPCLFVDGAPMFESADIIAFLQDRFPETVS